MSSTVQLHNAPSMSRLPLQRAQASTSHPAHIVSTCCLCVPKAQLSHILLLIFAAPSAEWIDFPRDDTHDSSTGGHWGRLLGRAGTSALLKFALVC